MRSNSHRNNLPPFNKQHLNYQQEETQLKPKMSRVTRTWVGLINKDAGPQAKNPSSLQIEDFDYGDTVILPRSSKQVGQREKVVRDKGGTDSFSKNCWAQHQGIPGTRNPPFARLTWQLARSQLESVSVLSATVTWTCVFGNNR